MDLSLFLTQNSPVLTAVFLLLCAMSLTSWYLIFWKAWALKMERKSISAFRAAYATTPDWPRHKIIGPMPSGGVGLLLKEVERLESVLLSISPPERRDVLGMHLVQGLDVIRVRLDKGLTVLASTGSAAPFIGLFGTVWGIYGALTKIAAEGNAGLAVVAGPMGEALVATAAGLFAAIPAVLAYNAFVRVNRLLVQDMRHIGEQLTAYLPMISAPQRTAETVKLVRDGR